MLSPEYLDSIGGDILAMYEELNVTIIENIARRIAKTNMVDSTSAYQLSQAQQAGAIYDDALQRISEVTSYTTKELQQLFLEAGTENISYENDIMRSAGLMPIDLNQSEPMMRQLKAGIIKTSRLINNMTMTTAMTAQVAYIQASTLAYNQVITGAFSYTDAIRRAVLSSASQGLSVLYPSGHRDKLDVAIRRAVLTGVNQTAAKMTEEMAEECECDYVEVTAHSGARESHASWQGRVYCRSGKDKKYPPFHVTGYGTGEGLCGWNCRHSFHMFWPGISKENYTEEMLDDYKAKNFEWNGKKLSDAECNSIQRRYERGIRETKRQLTALNEGMMASTDEELKAGFKEDFQKLSVRLKNQERDLKIFCQDTMRQSSAGRTSIAVIKGMDGKILGFNKSVAQKAVHSNKTALHEKYKGYLGTKSSGETVAKLNKIKFNGDEKILDGFIRAVDKGDVNVLVGYDTYKGIAKRIESELIGVKTSDGIIIDEYVTHFIDRVIGQVADTHRGKRAGVSIESVKDALKNPTLISEPRTMKDGDVRVTYTGKSCKVTISKRDNLLIQANPVTGGKYAKNK